MAHAAAAALLAYAEHTQGRALSHVQSLQVQRDDELIDLPVTTRRNLELVQTLRGEDSPTLFSLLDTCMTGMGSRMLKCWLLEPRRERSQAQQRLDAIDVAARGPVAGAARASSRAAATSSASPRASRCARCARASWWACGIRCEKSAQLARQLRRAGLAAGRDRRPAWRRPPVAPSCWRAPSMEEPAALVRDGGVIAAGLRRRTRRAARHPGQLRRLPARPGNAREGAHRHRQPARAVQQGARLLHRGHAGPAGQGAGRLPPPPDAEERRALHHARSSRPSRTRRCRRRTARWPARNGSTSSCSTSCRRIVPALTRLARALASLDALCALAERSLTLDWCRPQFMKEPGIEITQGRHPVVRERGWPKPPAAPSSPTTRAWARSSACRSSPAPTWAASRPTCARWR